MPLHPGQAKMSVSKVRHFSLFPSPLNGSRKKRGGFFRRARKEEEERCYADERKQLVAERQGYGIGQVPD